jgi:CheY-like chemotaxis protein
MAMTSSQDLLTLLNDILDLSKIDAHEMALESIAIDVTELCQQALAKFKLQLTKPLDLHLQIAPNFNPKRNSDPIRINQVLNNLLSNAIKFTNEGSVLLSVNGDAQEVRFTIKDTGIGIAEDKLEAIFHPFKQADDSTTRNFGGTGLGLAICQSLAELMQGNITVSSIPGVGSEFVFRVPMVITSMPFISNTSSKATEENFETFITPDLSHFKVLIVDDNESSGVILSRLLYPTKIGVDIVADANSAQERLASGKQYNLVITDLHMPNCNGAALCKMVRSNHPHIPILICTADLMYKQTLLDQAELFDDIMTKPITESVVIKKLTRLL